MSKINLSATSHGSKSETYIGGTVIKYNVFSNSSAADKKRISAVTKAYNIVNSVDKKINLQGPCNKYFKRLSNGKTFRHYWRQSTIFINLSPSLNSGFYGATHSNMKDICISA